MRNGIARYCAGLLLACLLAVLAPCARAQDAPTPEELFNAKDYAGYLTKLDVALQGAQERPNLDKLATVAIALQQTGGWAGEAGDKAREMLAKSRSAQYLLILHEILDGNLTEMAALFPDGPLPATGWNTSAAAFREHGYPLAATAMEAMSLTNYSSDSVVKAITAWQSIPREQRDPIDRRILAEMETNPLAQRNIAETALQLFARPPAKVAATDPGPRDYFNLFLQIGDKAGLISIDTASRLRQYGKLAEAKEVAAKAVALYARDAAMQIDAAYFFAVQMQDPQAALAVYQQALKTVPDPACQSVRMSYLQFLERAQCTADIQTLAKHPDPLLAATALFFSRQYVKASLQYRAVLNNRKQPMEMRLAALSGLRMVNGADYLKTSASLLDELAKLDVHTRGPLLRWLGQNLWAAVDSSLNITGAFAANTVVPGYRLPDLRTAPGWEKQVTTLVDRLLALDAAAVLVPEGRIGNGARLNIAALYTVVHQPAKAVEVLQRQIQYGISTSPTEKPRILTSPQPGETVDLMDRLEAIFATGPIVFPEALTLVKPISTTLTKQIADDTKLDDLLSDMASLSTLFRNGVTALNRLSEDPQQRLPLTDIELLEIDKNAARDAMAGEMQAKVAVELIRNGIMPVLTATHGRAQTEAFTLLTTALTRYQQVNDPGVAAGEADYLAKTLEANIDPALKDYARQLREKFPPAQK